jgi:hypothetical protein
MRNLAREVTPQTDDPEAQKLCNQQTNRMMLDSFTNGLLGNPVVQVRFAMPSVMVDAVRIAVAIEQAESHKGKSEIFSVDTDYEEKVRKKTSRGSARGRNLIPRTKQINQTFDVLSKRVKFTMLVFAQLENCGWN